jgi:hypothetical protein
MHPAIAIFCLVGTPVHALRDAQTRTSAGGTRHASDRKRTDSARSASRYKVGMTASCGCDATNAFCAANLT